MTLEGRRTQVCQKCYDLYAPARALAATKTGEWFNPPSEGLEPRFDREAINLRWVTKESYLLKSWRAREGPVLFGRGYIPEKQASAFSKTI
jgi:hypothetical protein